MVKMSIYIVRSKNSRDVYYGSTQQTLSRRMSTHRAAWTFWKNGSKKYCSSFILFEQGDCYIELVEDVDLPTKAHVKALEGKYQRENDCVNIREAGRDPAVAQREHYLKPENNERIKKRARDYAVEYMANPENKAKQDARKATPEFKAACKARDAAKNATPDAKAYNRACYLARKARKAGIEDL